MNITLIYVGIFEGNNVVPPLGIMYVGAVLEKAGYRVQILDIDPLKEEYLEKLADFKPDLIGLGFLTTAYPRVKVILEALRGRFPSAVYFCGGPHTTALPEEVLRELDVAFVVIGEGEETALEACDRLKNGQTLEGVKGLMFKSGDQFIRNEPRPFIEDLDVLPLPARHLVDFKKRYLTFPGVIRGKWIQSTIVVGGRGCPFQCTYCGVKTIFGRRYRLRSVENVIAEIKGLIAEFGIKGLYFNDSSFTIDKNWVMEFSRALVRHELNLVWGCNSRVDTINEEMLLEMKKAGCIQFDFGVESGSAKVLKAMNKRITPEQILEAYRLVKKVGMRTGAYFMLGNKEETLEDAEETFAMAKRIKADYTVFFFTTPFPGTQLYDEAMQNRWLPDNFDFNEAWAFRETDYPVMTIGMDAEQLRSLRAKYQNYFFLRNYLNRDNLKIMLTLMFLAILNLRLTLSILKKTAKLGRFDTLAESFLTQYRLNIIRKQGKAT